MTHHAAITVGRAREEVERLWAQSAMRPQHIERAHAEVTFQDAPGDRGTEIHVTFDPHLPGGKVGDVVGKVLTTQLLARVKDDLRHFKQLVETGEIARSDATPEGERATRKLKQRPAQPLEKVGA